VFFHFISLGLLPPDNLLQQPWLRNDDDDDEAAEAYYALLQVTLVFYRATLRTVDYLSPVV